MSIRLKGLTDPRSVTMDATSLYWLDGTRQELLRASRAGTDSPVVIARWVDPAHSIVGPAVVDTLYVYWVAANVGDPGDTVILRAPKACNGEVTTIAKRSIYSNLVVEGDYLYFATMTNVQRIPR